MQTVRTGFSLIGTVAFAAALALFGALIFPVLVTAGERSPQASCQSNLREISAALMMYMQDYDGTAPLARSVEIDALPLVREGGAGESPFVLTGGPALLSPALGDCPPLARSGLWPLHLVLESYVSRRSVWRDPEDTGDLTVGALPSGEPASAAATAFARYGSSYQYHQGLVWDAGAQSVDRVGAAADTGRLRPVRSDELAHPADVPIMFDGEGYWHGRIAAGHHPDPDPYLAATAARGYNAVFADGRARFVPAAELLNRYAGRPLGLLYRDPRQ